MSPTVATERPLPASVEGPFFGVDVATSHFAWLDDSAHARGWIGRDADCVVESDDLSALCEVESLWRAHLQQVWI
ncbi:MAG: hypothetical protein ACPG77_00150, partial [Nannocystaceae bacterium]